MKIKDLKEILNRSRDDEEEVKIVLDIPSVGPSATTEVLSARFGFDWDRGLLLRAKDSIAPKSNQQSIYEKSIDLLMFIACEGLSKKHQSYEQRSAIKILLNSGYSEADFLSIYKLYKRDVPMKTSVSNFLKKNS